MIEIKLTLHYEPNVSDYDIDAMNPTERHVADLYNKDYAENSSLVLGTLFEMIEFGAVKPHDFHARVIV
jgi:hypothetical protein